MATWQFYGLRLNRNLVAVSYMLIAVLAFSVLPLVVNLAGGSESPFLFNAGLRLGVAIACLAFLASLYRHTLAEHKDLAVIKKHIWRWKHNKLLVWAVIGSFDYALFAWSIQFIDIAVSAVLFEIYPIGIIFLTAWVYRKEGRYQKITLTAVVLCS